MKKEYSILFKRVFIWLLLLLSIGTNYAAASVAKVYNTTSYYVAYDSSDRSQYVLVMPKAHKVYTHKAGNVNNLKRIDNRFVSFPSYNNGRLCFPVLKAGASTSYGAGKMAGKCYNVKFFYTQKKVLGSQTVFMLYYTTKAKLYEGIAGDSSSFKVVREGSEVFNARSVTSEDYSEFLFNQADASITLGKGDVVKTVPMSGVVNPLNGATVKVLGLDGVTLFTTTADANGSYTLQVDKNKLTHGYIVEAVGGTLDGKDFNGTLRAIYKGSHPLDKANVTLITTLVSRLATAKNRSVRSTRDNTLLDKRDAALQKLVDMGMLKKTDWFTNAPSFVNMDELRAVVQGDGFDAWLNGMISDLSDNDLESFKMAQFPKAHGGIVAVDMQSNISLFQGDSAERNILTEIFDSSEVNATYKISLENAPSWVTVTGRKLKIIVPENEQIGLKTFKITVIKENGIIGRSRKVNLSVLKKIVLVEGVLDEHGGKIENQWKDISISVESGKLSQSYFLKYIGGIDAAGNLVLDMDITPDMSDEESAYLHLIEPPVSLLKRNYFQDQSSSRSLLRSKSTSYASLSPINLNDGCHDIWPDRNGDGFIFDKVWMSNLAYFNDSEIVHKSTVKDSFSGTIVSKLVGIDDDSFGLPRLQDGILPVKNKIKKVTRCASALRSSVEDTSENLTTKTPVLFVHGFIPDGTLGGVDSREYFGKFPKLISEVNIDGESFIPFIFQWKTNARFQDVATDLGQAIDMITKKTGKKVHIIAHSFGGLLTRTLIQGLSTNHGVYNKSWSEKHIASITTVGTPHSGIFPDPKENVEFDNEGPMDFPRGVHGLSGVATSLCRAISCYQSGNVNSKEENAPSNWSEENKKNYKQAVIASNPKIYGIKDELGFIPYKLYKSLDNYPNIPTEQLMGLISSQDCLISEEDSSKCVFTIKLKGLLSVGDGLISIDGQRFNLEKANEVGNMINKLSLWSSSNIEEHLLGFDRSTDTITDNDFLVNKFDDNNTYAVETLGVEYIEQAGFASDKAFLSSNSLRKALRYTIGYNHSDTKYRPRVENSIYSQDFFTGGEKGFWTQQQYTEMGLNNCTNVNSCNNGTWKYVTRFLKLHSSENTPIPSVIKVTGDVEFIGPIQQVSNRSQSRETEAVPFPVTVEAYNGSVSGGLFNPLGRTTLNSDGTYELNVTYSPDTNYTVIAYPEGDTMARIGAIVRASASKFLTTYATLEESTLHFPTITLVDNNYEEGNLSIKVTDRLGNTINGFNAEILNHTGINVDANSQNVNTGYISTLPKSDYTVHITKEGYNAGQNECTVTANQTTECQVVIVADSVIAEGQISAVLSWGATPSDLDSHLVRKTNGSQDYHVYYGHRSDTDANLDRDDTSSFGPETITISSVNENSVYTYYVHNYSGGGGSVLANSGAKLELNFNGTQKSFNVPHEEGRYWKVFEIDHGRIIPCVTGCVGDSESSIVRDINKDAYLFENLPAKN